MDPFNDPQSELEHNLAVESALEQEAERDLGDDGHSDAEFDDEALASAGRGTDEDYGGGETRLGEELDGGYED